MPFCPVGQHPEAKPGYGIAVSMSVASVAALLNNIPTAWAVPLAAYIGAVSYELNDLCTNDPPALPTITADDVAALFGMFTNPIAYIESIAKFQQFLKYYAWFQFCQCSGGTTPAATPGQAAPSGSPNLDPITPAVSTQCGAGNWGTAAMANPQVAQRACISVFPLDLQTVEVTMTNAIASGAGLTVAFDWQYDDELQSPLASVSPTWRFTLGPGISATRNLPIYSAATNLCLKLTTLAGAGTANCSATGRFFCRSQGGSGASQPTFDPAASAQLDAILKLVTLIQRQHVPFAYVDGAVHAGLSSSGEISVDGVLGARIELTTVPSRAGVVAGDPNTLFDIGWVAWGNTDGFGPREFIQREDQLSLPPSAGVYTTLGYTLTPGVVATITELIREP